MMKKDSQNINEILEELSNFVCLLTSEQVEELKSNLSVQKYKKNENIYKELPKHGISFPFPQLDVHVKQD